VQLDDLVAEVRDRRTSALLKCTFAWRVSKENRMADNSILIPAAELAAKNKAHFPNEGPEYRRARNALLAEDLVSHRKEPYQER
jgi:hypothetical protein